MSNGSSPCPPVILPFGVFPAAETVCPLEDGDFPGPDPLPCLEDFVNQNSPFDATPLDGFDNAVNEEVAILDALDAALGGLGNDLLEAFTEADAIDAEVARQDALGFSASLVPSSSAVSDLGTLLGSVVTPAPGGGGSGGTTVTHHTAYVLVYFHSIGGLTEGSPWVGCFAVDVSA